MSRNLFQHNTLGTLMAGKFEGTLPVRELLSHGTMGIGTLHGLDGELVVVDGTAYQLKVDGSCNAVEGDELTPYAAITDFQPEQTLIVSKKIDKEAFETMMLEKFSSTNVFQAVKVKGTFRDITCRSVEKQEAPYPRLVEVSRKQTEFSRELAEGTLVGFYAPKLFGTIAAIGFHVHFLSSSLDFGGHIINFSLESGSIEWQTIETVEQHFPVNSTAFMESDIDYDNILEDIEEAE